MGELKYEPSRVDMKIWAMRRLSRLTRSECAEQLGIDEQTVDYHVRQAERLSNIDLQEFKKDINNITIPIAVSAYELIAETFATKDPKYVDAAIKYLNNNGYTIEQKEVTITNRDNRDASVDFEAVMQKVKSRAVDAEIVNVASTSPSLGGESTPTSSAESESSILPLDKSHIKNPNLASQEIVHQKSKNKE